MSMYLLYLGDARKCWITFAGLNCQIERCQVLLVTGVCKKIKILIRLGKAGGLICIMLDLCKNITFLK